MAETSPSPAHVEALLAQLLAGAAGGTVNSWAALIGTLGRKQLSFYPRTNWTVRPVGTATEQDAIARAVEIVQAQHPYVAW